MRPRTQAIWGTLGLLTLMSTGFGETSVVLDRPDRACFVENTQLAVVGDVGFVPSYNASKLWWFSLLTGQPLDPDGLTLPNWESYAAVFPNSRLVVGPFLSVVVDASDPTNLAQLGVLSGIAGENVAVDSNGINGYIYVDDDAPLEGDGRSWDTAFRYLQDALAVASSADEVRVAAGVYKPDQDEAGNVTPGERTATFQLRVAIYGGYAGYGAPDPDARDIGLHETVLSGDLAGDDGPGFDNNSENSYHVVTGSASDQTAILDGVTIAAGNADGSSPNDRGGGVYCSSGSSTLTNDKVYRNAAWSAGAGIWCYSSSAAITGCAIMYNVCTYNGAGIYCFLSEPTIRDCSFVGNSAGVGAGGGGIAFHSAGHPTITNCVFAENAAGEGGGVFCLDADPLIEDSIFLGNSATGYSGGGGIQCRLGNPTVINCTFTYNTAFSRGGAISFKYPAGPQDMITNCILWADSPVEIYVESGDPVVTYSDIEGSWPGQGNIDADPLFVDLGGPNYNYRLSTGSPCIDSGRNAAVPSDILTDLDGHPRFVDDPATPDCQYAPGTCGTAPIVDMGAYEYQGPLPRGDLNCDGLVNIDDVPAFVLALIDPASYLAAYPGCNTARADVDADGTANGRDIQAFVNLLFGL